MRWSTEYGGYAGIGPGVNDDWLKRVIFPFRAPSTTLPRCVLVLVLVVQPGRTSKWQVVYMQQIPEDWYWHY